MAQFIQSNQLSEIPGSAGNQQPIGGQGNLANLIDNIGGVADMAGTMYADAKANSLVKEEIENMDAAIAAAEERAKAPASIAKLDVPESLNMDQKEWDLLSNAVRNGEMTQDRARLIAQSRLRTRIAEEPFYADRMRKSASSVIGFNIESEAAQQYFASFPTRAQVGEGKNKYRQDMMNQATAVAEATGFSVDAVYKQLVTADYAAERKKAAAAQVALGNMGAQQFTTEFVSENQKTLFGTLFGEIKLLEAQTGQPVDGVAFSRVVREQEQAAIDEFNDLWVEGEGIIGSPEYNRSLEAVTAPYRQAEEFVKDYGIDNMTAIEIERMEQAREVYSNEFFPQMKLLTDTFGQQVASDLINIASMNPAKRDLLMSQSPELKRAFEMMGSDPAQFNRKMADVAGKIVGGQELTSDDAPYVDTVARDLHDGGSEDTKKSVIQGLADSGANWKSLSILSDSSPRLEPEENVAYYAEMYERELPLVINRLGTMMADIGANNYDFVVEEDGTLRLDPLSPEAARPSENLRNLQAELDRINVFAQGFKKGWGRTVPDNLDQYKAKLNSQLQQSVTDARDTVISTREEEFLGLLEAGNMREAGRIYGQLREEAPDRYDMVFDDVVAEIRRRAGTEEEGQGTMVTPGQPFPEIITEPLPDLSPEEARQQLEQEVNQFSSDVNEFGVPAVELVEGQNGRVEVRSNRPLSLPQGKLNEMRRLADQINRARQGGQ